MSFSVLAFDQRTTGHAKIKTEHHDQASESSLHYYPSINAIQADAIESIFQTLTNLLSVSS